jgi:hypothetical protein
MKDTPLSENGRIAAGKWHGMCESGFKAAGERHGVCESAFMQTRDYTKNC